MGVLTFECGRLLSSFPNGAVVLDPKASTGPWEIPALLPSDYPFLFPIVKQRLTRRRACSGSARQPCTVVKACIGRFFPSASALLLRLSFFTFQPTFAVNIFAVDLMRCSW